ncbi:hypothetical protein NicSoilB4_24680 [Arthrobacter sp. NicSoilB4]|uniref:hypothetical protein n=1 Tax=Arthrobacter sp. NicSoilB4 TaxID=2830997 RepID=UPI001CC570A5|nr:hypothetical protein [Arthrobacter sp. NicSoilB4]BCW67705.1 hypothetical protein NicSoilB4_24680 [Arthrobacter sp. NicSoilB4]
MKQIPNRMALWLCSINLVPGLARFPRAHESTGPRAEQPGDHRERGDVPGWVMITLMSAVLVAALLALAGPALEGLFNQAMDKVGQ